MFVQTSFSYEISVAEKRGMVGPDFRTNPELFQMSGSGSMDFSMDFQQPTFPQHFQSVPPHPVESFSPPIHIVQNGSERRSRKRPKTCGVCGDRARSFHFGGLSCDSCKAFFRRAVQSDGYQSFRCPYENTCNISISTRKNCQSCRFNKCVAIGMEKSWVMTDEERNFLHRQRLEKKQAKSTMEQDPELRHEPPAYVGVEADLTSSSFHDVGGKIVLMESEKEYKFQVSGISKEPTALSSPPKEYVPDVNKMLEYMTYEEQNEIKSVVEAYHYAYKEIPFKVPFDVVRRDTLEIIEMFTTILRRFAYFSKLNADFAALSKNDQGNLLRAAVMEMCLLRGAVCFDTERNRWPSSTMESLKDCPQLRLADMQHLVSHELFKMHLTFIFNMKKLKIDEPIAMLLIMIVLFSPERTPLENKVAISQFQEKYLVLLKKYVSWKFGRTEGSRMYPQLLTKLSDLRELNDLHSEYKLNMDQNDIDAIKQSLVKLQLNQPSNKTISAESRQHHFFEAQVPDFAQPSQSSLTPAVTQSLIQGFANLRIPTLLGDHRATIDTEANEIRQVQQTLGSLFPGTEHSPIYTQNMQPITSHHTKDFESESRQYLRQAGAVLPVDPRLDSSSMDSCSASASEILSPNLAEPTPLTSPQKLPVQPRPSVIQGAPCLSSYMDTSLSLSEASSTSNGSDAKSSLLPQSGEIGPHGAFKKRWHSTLRSFSVIMPSSSIQCAPENT